jgi:hypothetical protein
MVKQKREYSVTEYAQKLSEKRGKPITRMGIFYMIKNKKLPLGVKARKVGQTYVITDNSDKYEIEKESQ